VPGRKPRYCDFGGFWRSSFRKTGNGKFTAERGDWRTWSRLFAPGRGDRWSR